MGKSGIFRHQMRQKFDFSGLKHGDNTAVHMS